jgi:hypothetical protein
LKLLTKKEKKNLNEVVISFLINFEEWLKEHIVQMLPHFKNNSPSDSSGDFMKTRELTKYIAKKQKASVPEKIELFKFLVRNALKNRNINAIWEFSLKISMHYFDEFWDYPLSIIKAIDI